MQCVLTCLYLLAQDVSQNVFIDVMNQDETAVVGENVLLQLLQLLDAENNMSVLCRMTADAETESLTHSFPAAVHLPGETGQRDLQQSFLVESSLDHSAVMVQLLLTNTYTHT